MSCKSTFFLPSISAIGSICTGPCGLVITERTEWITKGKTYGGETRLVHRRKCWPCGLAYIREWDRAHKENRRAIDRRSWHKNKNKNKNERLANRRDRRLDVKAREMLKASGYGRGK